MSIYFIFIDPRAFVRLEPGRKVKTFMNIYFQVRKKEMKNKEKMMQKHLKNLNKEIKECLEPSWDI
jgi:16S rRNA A1518/A1519 N6-dimethyltransferase RsmA/KsgA/DIM1 with predicted DNA glycosylase/AP lyase activity